VMETIADVDRIHLTQIPNSKEPFQVAFQPNSCLKQNLRQSS